MFGTLALQKDGYYLVQDEGKDCYLSEKWSLLAVYLI